MALGVQQTLSRRGIVVAGAVLFAAGASALPASGAAITYTGNGATGFGGPIGQGSLTITDNGDGNLNFSLSPHSDFTGNVLVLYVDSTAGGINNTSTLTDQGDGSRTAISGLSGNGRTLATFAPGFGADYAIAIEPQFAFAGVFNLATPSSFVETNAGNYAGSGTGPITFTVSRSTLGLGASDPFTFEGTLISPTAYRSNETLGTSVTAPNPSSPGDAPNAGFTGTTTFSRVETFPVPEPATLGVLAAGATLLAARRRRR